MQLTAPQIQTLKTWVNARLAEVPTRTENDLAALANANAAPDYWLWRSKLSRATIYHGTGPGGTAWDWATYKAQTVPEQNAWTQMFMGDEGPVGNVNFRAGILAIFSGSGGATQRTHCYAVSRRLATVGEKLFAVAVVSPPANTGNVSADTRGATTNPDNLGIGSDGQPMEGQVTPQNIIDAQNAA